MNEVPDFMLDADNVYRTTGYIVKQSLSVQFDETEGNSVISNDVFYKRTKRRDSEYEYVFSGRKNIDGKRLPSNMYSRKYVE